MNDSELTPVALYARVSSDRQDVDLSVAAQLRALRDYAGKNSYVVVREYVDEAKSGLVDDRPEFNRMIDEAGLPEAPFREVLVWKFSRFTRNREHAIAYKSLLRRRGVTVVSITEHTDDTPTARSRRPTSKRWTSTTRKTSSKKIARFLRFQDCRHHLVRTRPHSTEQDAHGPASPEMNGRLLFIMPIRQFGYEPPIDESAQHVERFSLAEPRKHDLDEHPVIKARHSR